MHGPASWRWQTTSREIPAIIINGQIQKFADGCIPRPVNDLKIKLSPGDKGSRGWEFRIILPALSLRAWLTAFVISSNRCLLGDRFTPLINKKPYVGISSLKSIKRMGYGRVYEALKSARFTY